MYLAVLKLFIAQTSCSFVLWVSKENVTVTEAHCYSIMAGGDLCKLEGSDNYTLGQMNNGRDVEQG